MLCLAPMLTTRDRCLGLAVGDVLRLRLADGDGLRLQLALCHGLGLRLGLSLAGLALAAGLLLGLGDGEMLMSRPAMPLFANSQMPPPALAIAHQRPICTMHGMLNGNNGFFLHNGDSRTPQPSSINTKQPKM